MTFKRGGRKSRRGGQTDNDTEGETDTDKTTTMQEGDEEEEEEGTTTTTPTAGGKRRAGGRSRKHRRSVLYAARSGGRSRRRRGGQSAAAYEMTAVGTNQWNNVFNNPQTMNAPTGNGLWSADLTQNVNGVRPADPSLGKLMQGGKRRHKRSRRGGNLLDIVSQAAVPFGLLGLQQTYSKRRRGGRKSRRHSRRQVR